MLITVSTRDFGLVSGKVLLNGPYGLTMAYVQATFLGSILIAGLFGQPSCAISRPICIR